MSDVCQHCGSERVTLFRDGEWFCRRRCYGEWLASICYRVMVIASKLCGPFPVSLDTEESLKKLEELAEDRPRSTKGTDRP